MKLLLTLLLFIGLAVTPLTAQNTVTGSLDGDVSLKLEIERAIAKGATYLTGQQDPETGSWSDPTLPAISALAISALMGDPNLDLNEGNPAAADKGYEFLLSNVKSDGGIYGKGLATYNTSLSIMALAQSGNEEHLLSLIHI